jgi:hypothetical protein
LRAAIYRKCFDRRRQQLRLLQRACVMRRKLQLRQGLRIFELWEKTLSMAVVEVATGIIPGQQQPGCSGAAAFTDLG